MTKEEALKILDTIPTIGEQVDALEMAIEALTAQKKGKWIYNPLMSLGYQCSVCGNGVLTYDFCPNCGADMRGGKDDLHDGWQTGIVYK